MGRHVYVIGKDITVPRFKNYGTFWYKNESKAFCFLVKHVKGKSKKVCVREAPAKKPKITHKITEDYLVLKAPRESVYRVYPLIPEGIPSPFPLLTFKKEAKLRRRYEPYTVGIAEELNPPYETEPLLLEVPKKPYPVPEPPSHGGYIIYKNKLILYWFHEKPEDLLGFHIYKNKERITEKPVKQTTYTEENPSLPALYEIKAVNKFMKESKPLPINVYPETPQP